MSQSPRDPAMDDIQVSSGGSQITVIAAELTSKVKNLSDQLVVSQETTEKLAHQQESQKKTNRWLKIIIAVVAAIAIALGFGYFQQRHIAHKANHVASVADTRQQCLEKWANSVTERNNYLLPLSNARNAAADNLIRTLIEPQSKIATDFEKALKVYVEASNAYLAAQKKHPVPQSPSFTCK